METNKTTITLLLLIIILISGCVQDEQEKTVELKCGIDDITILKLNSSNFNGTIDIFLIHNNITTLNLSEIKKTSNFTLNIPKTQYMGLFNSIEDKTYVLNCRHNHLFEVKNKDGTIPKRVIVTNFMEYDYLTFIYNWNNFNINDFIVVSKEEIEIDENGFFLYTTKGDGIFFEFVFEEKDNNQPPPQLNCFTYDERDRPIRYYYVCRVNGTIVWESYPPIISKVQDYFNFTIYNCERIPLKRQEFLYNPTPDDTWKELMQAVKDNNTELVEIYIYYQNISSFGLNINAIDEEGNTPLSTAIFYNHTNIAELLRKAGAKR